jgi:hypothetical protein
MISEEKKYKIIDYLVSFSPERIAAHEYIIKNIGVKSREDSQDLYGFITDVLVNELGLLKKISNHGYDITNKLLEIRNSGGYEAYLNHQKELKNKEQLKDDFKIELNRKQLENLKSEKRYKRIIMWIGIITAVIALASLFKGILF